MLTSKYFQPSEYQCKCGCGLEPQQALIDKMDALREQFGSPIEVSCMSRCPTHNKAVGGAPNSNHITGQAADLIRTQALYDFVAANLESMDLYQEDPSKTISWLHLQINPPKSGHRIFIP